MNTFEASITAVAISFCLLCALLTRQLFTRLSLTFFVVYLLLEAFGFTVEWLLVHPGSPYKALWLALFMASSFLMAPCLWLFAQETSANRRPPLYLTSAEWSVIALGMIMTIPLMLAAHSGSVMNDPNHPAVGSTSRIIHETMLFSIALFLLQVPWYLKKCLRIIKVQTWQDMALFSNIDDMPLNTLRVLIWVMLGNWLLNLLRTLRALILNGPTHLDVVFTCAEVAITLWAMYVILKRALMFATDDQKPVIAVYEPDTEGPTRQDDDKELKYAKSSLNDIARQRIETKLQKAMQADQLFRRSNLKLRDLCDYLNENTHYVSQVINQSLGTTFYELVNQYRIEAAKDLLIANAKTSVLDIALEVGFNSKTTFNTAFKRATGMTPREYKSAEASEKAEVPGDR